MILTPEVLADVRAEATEATRAYRAAQIAGPVVLALLDRVEALEKERDNLRRTLVREAGAAMDTATFTKML